MAPRFKVGDLLEVYVYDQGDEVWRHGIVLISGYSPTAQHTKKGCYNFKTIKGDACWISYNVEFFDNINTHIWIGNIEDDPILPIQICVLILSKNSTL